VEHLFGVLEHPLCVCVAHHGPLSYRDECYYYSISTIKYQVML
jgi:hypothetical protein